MTYIRSAIFAVYLVVATLAVATFGLPAPFISEGATRAVIKFWAKLILGGLKIICGISHRIEGEENLPASGAIVACNHQSMWETLIFFAILPKPVAIFKTELLRIPVYGWWGARGGSIPVDRTAGAKSVRLLMKRTKEKYAEGAQIIVFPEGTRSPVGARPPLQPGVAGIYLATGAPCVPAGHDSGRFWRHPGQLKIPGVITLKILPAIPPGLDRKTFLATLRARIESARPDLASPRETDAADATAETGNAACATPR